MYVAKMISESYFWLAFGRTEDEAKEALLHEWNAFFGIDDVELDYPVEIWPCSAGDCCFWEV